MLGKRQDVQGSGSFFQSRIDENGEPEPVQDYCPMNDWRDVIGCQGESGTSRPLAAAGPIGASVAAISGDACTLARSLLEAFRPQAEERSRCKSG